MGDEGRLVAGRYRLGERIGTGAMGVVWRARDELLHRTVAIKQLLLTAGSGEGPEQAAQRAMREGRIAARLQHPNAVTVYDVAEEDDQPWLVMEYVPSRSLAAVLAEEGTLPPVQVARIGVQVAGALAAAHAVGVVHRDVKPGNVLLTEDGVVKITDFGISRATDDVVLTATGLLSGTPAYLAPEVAQGEAPAPSSDVFALGATLYAAVEGKPPFGFGDNTLALLHVVAAGKVTPPERAGELTPVLTRLLAVDPATRPDMRTAQEELAAVTAGVTRPVLTQVVLPVPARPPGTPAGSPPRPVTPAPQSSSPRPPGPPHSGEQGRPNPQHSGQQSGPQANMRMDPRAAARRGYPAAPAGGPQGPHGPPGPRGPHGPQGSQRPAGPGQARRGSGKKVAAVLIVVAALLVVGTGALVTHELRMHRSVTGGRTTGPGSTGGPATSGTGTTGTGDSGSAGSTQSEVAAPGPDSGTVTGPVTYADMRALVLRYYQLLPSQPDQAFAMLTSHFQSKTGGLATFEAFYQTISSIAVSRMLPAGPDSVSAVLTFTTVKGAVTHERYLFTVVDQGGTLLIADGVRTGSASF